MKKKNPLKPDNDHLHQLIYFYIKKNYKLKTLTSNNISSLILIFFNFFILYVASLDIYHTRHQLIVLSLALLIYLIAFFNIKNILKQ